MTLEQMVRQLDAAAEPTRLRLLTALLGGELPVGDLVAMLGQSQPRVSRHLRLLAEADLLDCFREGRSVFYRWSAGGLEAGVARSVAAVAASHDPTVLRDRERLVRGARQREREALRRALRSGGQAHGADPDHTLGELLEAVLAPAGTVAGTAALVIGCGSGDLVRLLLPWFRLVVGTEPSAHRRQLARARLRQLGVSGWSLRDAGPGQLPFAPASFDLVVLQDVLGADRGAPARAVVSTAAHLLRPGGRLLLVDRILPTDGELTAILASAGFAIARRQWAPGRAPDRALLLATPMPDPPARTGTHD